MIFVLQHREIVKEPPGSLPSAPMPSGVEHLVDCFQAEIITELPSAPMPSGVEHSSPRSSPAAPEELPSAPMPSGVEHSWMQIAGRDPLRPALRSDALRR